MGIFANSKHVVESVLGRVQVGIGFDVSVCCLPAASAASPSAGTVSAGTVSVGRRRVSTNATMTRPSRRDC